MPQAFSVPAKYAMYSILFKKFTNGKEEINLKQAAALVKMMMSMSGMPDKLLKHEGFDDAVKQGVSTTGAPPIALSIGETIAKQTLISLVKSLPDHIETLLAGPFDIIDSNGSGTISMKEFLGIVLLTQNPLVQNMFQQGVEQAPIPTPGAPEFKPTTAEASAMATSLVDALFYIVDADDNGALSKAEIVDYVERIIAGALTLFEAALEYFRTSACTVENFEVITKDAFDKIQKKCAESKEAEGVFTAEGNISLEKVTALIEQAAIKDMEKKAMCQTNAMVEKHVKDQLLEHHEKSLAKYKAAAVDGVITKDAWIKTYCEILSVTGKGISENYLKVLPKDAVMQMSMVLAMGVDPGKIVQSMLCPPGGEMPCNLATGIFNLFSCDGETIKIACFEELSEASKACFDEANKDKPEVFCKFASLIVSTLLDTDHDGTVSPKEAAALVKKFFDLFFFGIEDVIIMMRGIVEGECLHKVAVDAFDKFAPLPPGFLWPLEKKVVNGIAQMMAMQQCDQAGKEEMKQEAIFNMFDKDGDGFLNYEEYKEMLSKGRGSAPVSEFEWKMLCGHIESADEEKGIPLEGMKELHDRNNEKRE